MKQSRFAQRELVDHEGKGLHLCGPSFPELNQSGLDLRRVQRCRRLFPNPMIPAIHRTKHHAILMERPVNELFGLGRRKRRQNAKRFLLDLEVNRTVAGQLAIELQANVLIARYATAARLAMIETGATNLRDDTNMRHDT